MRQTQDHAHALTSARSPMIVRDWLFGIGPWLLAAPFFLHGPLGARGASDTRNPQRRAGDVLSTAALRLS